MVGGMGRMGWVFDEMMSDWNSRRVRTPLPRCPEGAPDLGGGQVYSPLGYDAGK